MVKGTTYSFAALIAMRALGLVGSVVVARILGRTNLGMLSIVNNLTGLGLFFAALGVPTALTKFVAQHAMEDRSKLPSIVGTSLAAMLVPLLLLSLGLFIGAGPIATRVYHEPGLVSLIRIAAAVLFFNCLGSGGFGQALLQGLKEVKRISLINIVANAVSVPLLIALTALFHLPGALAAQLLVALLSLTLILFGLQHAGFGLARFRFDRAFLPQLANLAFPAFISGLVMTPALWITTTRLQNVRGFSEVGLFNICWGLFQMILFLPAAVGMPLVPMIAESWNADPERMKRLLRTALDLTAFATLVLSTTFTVLARPAIYALYGHGFLDAVPAMMLMAGAVFSTGIGYIIGYYFAGTGKMWTGMAFNVVWFALLILLALMLIPHFGVVGLAAAFAVSYAVMALGMLGYVRHVIRIPVTYLLLLVGISVGVTLFSRTILSRLHGITSIGIGLGTLAAVAIIDYVLLPEKSELRHTLDSVSVNLRSRLNITRSGAHGL